MKKTPCHLLCAFLLLLLFSACPAWAAGLPGSAAGWSAANLIPMPREFSPAGSATLVRGVSIRTGKDLDDRFAARDLSSWLGSLDIGSNGKGSAFRITLLRADSRDGRKLLDRSGVKFDPDMHDEGYVILPSPHGLDIIGATGTGIFYGAQTVRQLVTGRGSSALIEKARIRDWPAMRRRGISDDLSRGPIPTLEYQKRIIRTLAAYKLNLYSPYFENTLAYQANPLAALPGESLTQADARELVKYAHQYHVMVVPEQESFGHLHKVLTYQQYAPLAETPLGTVLTPGQSGSLDLIGQWFGELGNIFPAPYFHIGADETFDLGLGQTKSAVQARGLGPVYTDFLIAIHNKLAPLHRQLLFWGDIALKDPEQVKRLPRDMIAVPWTYSPQPQGFKKWIQPFADAGLETWVAPGINNWNRMYPDTNDALLNIQGFVADGQALHSTGMLNTVWNDDGEGLWPENWYGVLFGAAAAWQPGRSDLNSFENAYGRVYQGDATGALDRAQREIMAIYQLLHQQRTAGGHGLPPTDTLFWIDPWSLEGGISGPEVADALRPIVPELRLHAEEAITLVAQARAAGILRDPDATDALDLAARRFDLLGQKFETADEIARLYRQAYTESKQPGNSSGRPPDISGVLNDISGGGGLCQDMTQGYSWSRERYSELWLRVNRPYWLRNVQARYDAAIQFWMERQQKFRQAQYNWRRNASLPSPEEMGIPAN